MQRSRERAEAEQDHGFTRNGGAAGRKDEMAPGLYRSRADRGPEEPRANGPFQGVGRQGMETLDARTENPTGKAARPERRPESRACPPPAAKVKRVKACGVPYRSALYCSYYSAHVVLEASLGLLL